MTATTDRSAGSVRQALLDAAYDEVVSGSWARARMADVARAAGVSRQTLYNEFGTKDALAEALAQRQTGLFLDGVDRVLATGTGSPVEVFAETVRWSLDHAHDDPMIKSILAGAEGELLPYLTTRAQPVLAAASAHLAAFLAANWPGHDAELAGIAESFVRLIVSHIVLTTEPSETTAHVLARLLARSLGDPR